MKKVFAIVAAVIMMASSMAVYAEVSNESVQIASTVSATRITLTKIGKGMGIRRSATVERNSNGQWVVDGNYIARSGDGYGYSYVVQIGNVLWGFNI